MFSLILVDFSNPFALWNVLTNLICIKIHFVFFSFKKGNHISKTNSPFTPTLFYSFSTYIALLQLFDGQNYGCLEVGGGHNLFLAI
jgi:hypothetical protein